MAKKPKSDQIAITTRPKTSAPEFVPVRKKQRGAPVQFGCTPGYAVHRKSAGARSTTRKKQTKAKAGE